MRTSIPRPGLPMIVVAPPLPPPPEPQALVEEQDTSLALGMDPVLSDAGADYDCLVRSMAAQRQYSPGDIVIRRAEPLIFQAIVHDLEHDPSWREEWIITALDNLLQQCRRQCIRTLAMPALGSVHGRFGQSDFIDLLFEALGRNPLPQLRQIWLIAPAACSLRAANLP